MKYHVNNEGKVGVCRAEKGMCPFGDSAHFDTKEQAENYAYNRNEQEYGLLATKSQEFNNWREQERALDKYFKENRVELTHSVHDRDTTKLEELTKRLGKTKIGRLGSLLKMDGRTSYSKALKEKRLNPSETLRGDFQELEAYMSIVDELSDHKASTMGASDERTSFNRWIDKDSFHLLSNITHYSHINKPNKTQKYGGLGLAIQGLRAKGYTIQEIKTLSIDNSIIEEVYHVYGEKYKLPRSGVFGATELENMLDKHFGIKEKAELLGWD